MKHALIALEHASGNVSRMQFGTYRKRHQLDDRLAENAGFTLDEEGNWRRDPTDQNIEAEISKTVFSEPVSRWWRVSEDEELPPRRRMVRGNVIQLVPTEEPLPRFLRQPDDVSSEMHQRLEEFDRRAQQAVDAARESISKAKYDGERIEALQQQWDRRFDALEAKIAASFEKLGGKT